MRKSLVSLGLVLAVAGGFSFEISQYLPRRETWLFAQHFLRFFGGEDVKIPPRLWRWLERCNRTVEKWIHSGTSP